MNKRPVPDSTWADITSALFSREPKRVEDALIMMAGYSYDPRVRDQLRKMADTDNSPSCRYAVAILRRQRRVDLGESAICAGCAFLNPLQLQSIHPQVHQGVLERKVRCDKTGDYVWPTLGTCHQYVHASDDRIEARGWRPRRSQRNPWG